MIRIKKILIVTAESAYIGESDDNIKSDIYITLYPLQGEPESFLDTIKKDTGLAIIVPLSYPTTFMSNNIKLWVDIDKPATKPIIYNDKI